MADHTTTWTKQELKTYILIYCANANFNESRDQIDFILSKVDKSNYDKIHREFEKDNDYQSIQKIRAAYDRLGYSGEGTDRLLKDMKALFTSDDEFDAIEQSVFLGLKHILA